MIISEKSRRRGTYNAVVGAADGVGTAGVATDTDDGNGAAADTEEGIDGPEDDSKQASKKASHGVAMLRGNE